MIKYTEDDYKRKCQELNLIYIGNSKHKKKGTMIHFVCPIHKDKGTQLSDWSHFKSYTKGCPYCTGRYKTSDEVLSEIKGLHIEFLSEYKGCEKPIKCRCKTCGHEWTTVPKVFTTNKSGCPVCGLRVRSEKRTKTQEQFEKELSVVNSDIDVVGKYIGTHKKIRCHCRICDIYWDAYPANLLNKSAACPNCNISNGEREMVQCLREIGLNIEQQKTLKYLSDRNPLRLDAYCEDLRIAFEYNGEQHYRAVDFAGRGDEWALKQFKLTQIRDSAKKRILDENNIRLITVPYWERDNIKSYLEDKLKDIKIA